MMADSEPQAAAVKALGEGESRRNSVRLTTVYGGRVCQSGRAFGCVVSDVSASGARIKLKETNNHKHIVNNQPVQLIFDRLGEYKALNGSIAWLADQEGVLGITFTDNENILGRVLSKLMPNRWNLVHSRRDPQNQA